MSAVSPFIHKSRFLYSMYDGLGECWRNFLDFIHVRKRVAPSFPEPSLKNQTVIVTGGNRGLGRGVTFDLAGRGARVIIACRDQQSAAKTIEEVKREHPEADVISKELDLASFKSIKTFAQDILDTEPRLDILINNAALVTGQRKESLDGLELVLGVNYFGLVLLTTLLQEIIEKSPDGKIINVSSLVHHECTKIRWHDLNATSSFDFVKNYGHSKLAVMLYTRKLAQELYPKGVRVYAVDPGVSPTDLADHTPAFFKWAVKSWVFRPLMRNPQQGANSIIFQAIHPKDEYDPKEYYYW